MNDKELQLENGNYTRVVNRLLEELAHAKLLGAEYAVCLYLMRKTYGFQKKSDQVSLSQFEAGTGLSRPTVVKALKNLQLVKVLKLVKTGSSVHQSSEYSINKYFGTWELVNPSKLVGKSHLTSKDVFQKLVKTPLPELVKTSKHTKETLKKRKKLAPRGGAGVKKKEVTYNPLGAEVIEAFVQVDPKNKNYYGNTNQRAACDFLIEEYTLAKVLQVIKLLPKTNKVTYFPKIYTPCALRDSWQSLSDAFARMKNEPSRGRGLEE